jgi:hypothetical protein
MKTRICQRACITIVLSYSFILVGNIRVSMSFPLITNKVKPIQSKPTQERSGKQKKKPKTTRNVNQKMQGSPGAIQAGRDVKINLNQEPKPTDPFTIHIVCLKDSSASVTNYSFPYGDIKPISNYTAFIKLIHSLPNIPCNIDSITVFRLIDEEILRIGGKSNASSNGNNGVIVVTKEVLNGYRNNHLAFTQIKSFIDSTRFQQIQPNKEAQPSVSQNMNNSPGAIQAGGNVIINQGPPKRQLTEEQKSYLTIILSNNVKGSITVACMENGGPEACAFARQIMDLLKASGWTVEFTPMLAWGDPSKTIPEIYLLVQSNEKPPMRAIILQNALKAVGYEAIGFAKPELASDAVQLTIGTKHQ